MALACNSSYCFRGLLRRPINIFFGFTMPLSDIESMFSHWCSFRTFSMNLFSMDFISIATLWHCFFFFGTWISSSYWLSVFFKIFCTRLEKFLKVSSLVNSTLFLLSIPLFIPLTFLNSQGYFFLGKFVKFSSSWYSFQKENVISQFFWMIFLYLVFFLSRLRTVFILQEFYWSTAFIYNSRLKSLSYKETMENSIGSADILRVRLFLYTILFYFEFCTMISLHTILFCFFM